LASEADFAAPAPRPHGRVVVVGSLNEDVLIRLDAPFEPGATVLAREVRTAPGGKGLNQAVAAARSGARTALIGCVGEDAAGAALIAAAVRDDVSVAGVVPQPGAPTGRAYVLLEPDGGSTIAVDPGANALLAPGLLGSLANAEVLLVQLEVPPETVQAALELARGAGVATVLSLSPVVAGASDLLPLADVVVCNRGEARLVAQRRLGARARDLAPGELALSLVEGGSRAAVVTLGADGAVAVTSDGRIVMVDAPRATRVRDTTGAGDSSTGALGAALARGEDLATALRAAMRAGAAAVGGIGAQAGPLTERRGGR
jgi:ribokinase